MKLVKLYVKCHNVTNLQYFGRTIKEDVEKYKGSGVYWGNHLNKHGCDISNFIVGEFEENDPYLVEFALGFSAANNIVASDEWANLIVEDSSTSGQLLGDGTIFVKDENDIMYRVSENDTRYISKEFVGINRNKMPGIDKNGNCIQIDIDDERVLNGEINHHSKGKHKYTNTITGEDEWLNVADKKEYHQAVIADTSGENNPFFGKTHTEETKTKISKKHKDKCKYCKYCCSTVTKTSFNKFHGKNCKLNKNNSKNHVGKFSIFLKECEFCGKLNKPRGHWSHVNRSCTKNPKNKAYNE